MIPYGVCRFLFNGIMEAIQLTKKQIECGEFDQFDEKRLVDIKVAIEWYKKNALISAEHLVKELEDIERKYKRKI